jgi:hypothetical protein
VPGSLTPRAVVMKAGCGQWTSSAPTRSARSWSLAGRRLLARPAAAARTRRRTRGRHHPDRRPQHPTAPPYPPAGWQPGLPAAHRPPRTRARGAAVCRRPHLRAARPAPRHLGQRRRRPRPGRPRGRRLLAGRRGQRAAGRRPRLGGGPLTHPTRDDLRPHPAPRPADRAAGSRSPALAASHQRPPTRRPVPLATAPTG